MLESYAVFVNRVGQDDRVSWSYSHVVDRRGTAVAEGPLHEEALVSVDINLDDVRRWRREVPLVKESRLTEEGGDLSMAAHPLWM
jgi:predicted amidohydrolase